jgi:transposase
MVTDEQVRKLKKLIQTAPTLALAAAKAGMDEKTARRYRQLGTLPSEQKSRRGWRTRPDPFEEAWGEVVGFLEETPQLQALTLFDYLQRRHPGRFEDGQLRTLQRRVKEWRAVEGPAREVFFAQVHRPGELCQSDFSHMSSLGVTIAGSPFDHLIYHFVLTYSNWEAVTICFSESFESLSEGLQRALWELGGVPQAHRTDRLSTAVNQMPNPEEFTRRYRGLLDHYRLEPRAIQAGKANENGDVEQSHHRYKVSVDQALMLRGSRDFSTREEYARFLVEVAKLRNAGRRSRFEEERQVLKALPRRRLDASRRVRVRVGAGSTIRVLRNTYSVHSRLIGEEVTAQVGAEELVVWYGQRQVERLPRLRGVGKHRIDYRHVIGWLVRKPGAFENYRYRDELFPTSRFRMAYDHLRAARPSQASREYLKILNCAAQEGEQRVDASLGKLLAAERRIDVDAVELLLGGETGAAMVSDVSIAEVDLVSYDSLLDEAVAAVDEEGERCVAVAI